MTVCRGNSKSMECQPRHGTLMCKDPFVSWVLWIFQSLIVWCIDSSGWPGKCLWGLHEEAELKKSGGTVVKSLAKFHSGDRWYRNVCQRFGLQHASATYQRLLAGPQGNASTTVSVKRLEVWTQHLGSVKLLTSGVERQPTLCVEARCFLSKKGFWNDGVLVIHFWSNLCYISSLVDLPSSLWRICKKPKVAMVCFRHWDDSKPNAAILSWGLIGSTVLEWERIRYDKILKGPDCLHHWMDDTWWYHIRHPPRLKMSFGCAFSAAAKCRAAGFPGHVRCQGTALGRCGRHLRQQGFEKPSIAVDRGFQWEGRTPVQSRTENPKCHAERTAIREDSEYFRIHFWVQIAVVFS